MVDSIETPSQAIIKAATATVTVKDARGRDITLKKVTPLDRMRLFELIGGDNVKNEAYFGYAILACHVTAIDGDPIPRPASKVALEGIVQQLDDDGLNAVAEALPKHFMAKALTPDEEVAELKN